ncbi:hypothetical protein K523DRAFT_354839 [Schizophyllum commune Tattone D]|nr:hypothetical protein K523DRAFT_354839 [Schizophyllum commune Tattone D]
MQVIRLEIHTLRASGAFDVVAYGRGYADLSRHREGIARIQPCRSLVGRYAVNALAAAPADGTLNTGLGGTHFNASDIADKAKEQHDFTDFHPPQGTPREQWTIHRMDEGYTIKSVEHGSYIGFDGPGFVGSKEPFAFTIPNTDMYLNFARENSEPMAADATDRAGLSFTGHQSYVRYPPHWRTK